MREGYRSCFACFQWNKNFNLNHTHSNIKRIDDKWYIIIYLYNLKVVFALPFLQNMKYATTPISTSSTIITTVVTRARNFWFCTSIKREKRYASRFPVYRFSLFHWKRKKKERKYGEKKFTYTGASQKNEDIVEKLNFFP